MQIDTLMIDEGVDTFYNDKFRNIIETHIPYLKTHPTTIQLALDPHDLYRYEFDFYGLLNNLNIGTNLHWIVLRLNNLVSPNEFPINLPSILIPDIKEIERIRQIFKTVFKI